jgi:hypothetical protein
MSTFIRAVPCERTRRGVRILKGVRPALENESVLRDSTEKKNDEHALILRGCQANRRSVRCLQ